MVPDASVTACEVPDTSLLVIQVITKRGAVNLADILISQYISPEWVLIRIQFAYRHAIPVHEVRCLPVLRDCIPEPFCIIMVFLCEIISCYGYITVINVVRIMQSLCRCPVRCKVVFFRQFSYLAIPKLELSYKVITMRLHLCRNNIQF